MDDENRILQLSFDSFHVGETTTDEFLACAQVTLHDLAGRMMHHFPGVCAREDFDDIANRVSLKLWFALKHMMPPTLPEFLRLATAETRRVLIDRARYHLARHAAHQRHARWQPGCGVNAESCDAPQDFEQLTAWTAFHAQAAALPGKECEIFALHFYQGLTHETAAERLGISLNTAKRRWQSACLRLKLSLHGEMPEA
jgi:RNA polymerase sigma factor (sigma-70 family)